MKLFKNLKKLDFESKIGQNTLFHGKIYLLRLLYKIGKRGVRVRLPSCIVRRIKRRWKYNIVADEGVVESL